MQQTGQIRRVCFVKFARCRHRLQACLYVLSLAVARFSSGDNAVVMYFRFCDDASNDVTTRHVMGPMGQNRCSELIKQYLTKALK